MTDINVMTEMAQMSMITKMNDINEMNEMNEMNELTDMTELTDITWMTVSGVHSSMVGVKVNPAKTWLTFVPSNTVLQTLNAVMIP